MSSRTVLFIKNKAFYLTGYRESATHIRGYIENGSGTLFILKQSAHAAIGNWESYIAENLAQCTADNQLDVFRSSAVTKVTVPEIVRGDHNLIISWARGQLND